MSLESQISKFSLSLGLVYYANKPKPPKYETIEQYQYDIIGNLRTLRDYEPMLLPRQLRGLSDSAFTAAVTDVALSMAKRAYEEDRSDSLVVNCVAISKRGYEKIIERIESSEYFIRWL